MGPGASPNRKSPRAPDLGVILPTCDKKSAEKHSPFEKLRGLANTLLAEIPNAGERVANLLIRIAKRVETNNLS